MTFADYLQNQPLLRVAVAFAVGIVAGDSLAPAVAVWVWLTAAALAVAAFLIIGRRSPFLQSAIVFAGVLSTGAALTVMSERRLTFPFEEDALVHYEAVLTDEPKVRGKTLQCDLALTAVNNSPLAKPVNVKAAILRDTVTNDWRLLRAGSGIRAWSRMKPLANYRQGGNFDYVRWLHARGFRAQTFIFYTDWQAGAVSLHPLSRYDRAKITALRLRRNLVNRIARIPNDDGQRQAVVAAMVLGDKHALSRETKDVYSATGASHVLALSGLHLGIIYAMLTLLFGRWRRGGLAQALTLVAVWSYVFVVGMGASVVRSAVMLTIYSLCLVARRDKAQVNTLAFAALCLLAANPLYLWDMGFQMSFFAVLAIAIYYRPLYRLLPLRGKAAKALWGMAVLSLSAQIGTATLVAYYFGRFSCYFLLTNFIVVPAATAIIYGTAAMLVNPLPSLAALLTSGLGSVVGWLNGALGCMAALPGASISGIRINTLQLYLIYIIIICVSVAVAYAGKAKGLEKLDAFK